MSNQHSQDAARLRILRTRQASIRETVRSLAEKDDLTDAEIDRLDRAMPELEQINAEVTLATSAHRSALAGDPSVTSTPGADNAPGQWRQSVHRSAWESTDRAPSQRVGNAMRGIQGACETAEKFTGGRANIASSVRSTLERHLAGRGCRLGQVRPGLHRRVRQAGRHR